MLLALLDIWNNYASYNAGSANHARNMKGDHLVGNNETRASVQDLPQQRRIMVTASGKTAKSEHRFQNTDHNNDYEETSENTIYRVLLVHSFSLVSVVLRLMLRHVLLSTLSAQRIQRNASYQRALAVQRGTVVSLQS